MTSTTRKGETWLEPEELAGPNGGKRRRCKARCPDGKLRTFRCGIPDTFFTIPCKGGGFIYVRDGEYNFHPDMVLIK
jgi:hypothetical protein